MNETAFWDTSALVPLCVRQHPSPEVHHLAQQHSPVVWWATAVEMRSAFERLLRMKMLTSSEHLAAGRRLNRLRQGWREILPSDGLRARAEALLTRFPLKAADALQLAAALTWSMEQPSGRVFIGGDTQLLDAAIQLGFESIQV